MSEYLKALRRANQENNENRRKAIHNIDCSISELQPYDNAAFLEVVRLTNLMLKGPIGDRKSNGYKQVD